MNLATAIDALGVGILDIPGTGARDHCQRALAVVRDNVPAMVEALQRFSALPDAMAAYARAHGGDWQGLAAILSRIEGAPTAQPAAPTGGEG